MADQPNPNSEQPFVSHLIELRDRLLRIVLFVLVIFLCLFPFANTIYQFVADPLMAVLPENSSMIATQVASPFLTPFKLSLVAAIFVSMPFILYQFWAFVAPGLYQHEKKLAMPLLISSIVLFYVGVLFAYFVVFPLVFAFLTGVAPTGVTVMTDITAYLDFVLTLFFAFGLAFEVPIATILLVWTGVTTPKKLSTKRPYVIVGAFVLGMLLTPPDVISQTLLALPMWVLFEIGIVFSRAFVRARQQRGEAESGADKTIMPPTPQFREDLVPSDIDEIDEEDDEFRPLSEEEMEDELDRIEEGEGFDAKDTIVDEIESKIERANQARERMDFVTARKLLYEVLEEGDSDQKNVAKNILAQLDQDA